MGQSVAKSVLHKVSLLLSTIGLVDDQIQDDTCLSRIGRPSDNGRPRMLQIVCNSNETRERIVKSSPKLKEKGGQLLKIFINRDSHPVYQKENARLRYWLAKIRQKEEEKDNECDAKIAKGKLVWKDKFIDQNLLFY